MLNQILIVTLNPGEGTDLISFTYNFNSHTNAFQHSWFFVGVYVGVVYCILYRVVLYCAVLFVVWYVVGCVSVFQT